MAWNEKLLSSSDNSYKINYAPEVLKDGYITTFPTGSTTLPSTVSYTNFGIANVTKNDITWKILTSTTFRWYRDKSTNAFIKQVVLTRGNAIYIIPSTITTSTTLTDYCSRPQWDYVYKYWNNFKASWYWTYENTDTGEGSILLTYDDVSTMISKNTLYTKYPYGMQPWLVQSTNGTSITHIPTGYTTYANSINGWKTYVTNCATGLINGTNATTANKLILVSNLTRHVGTLLPSVTKTYTNTTWSTSKTWYIKVTITKKSNSTSSTTGNVVNYVTTWGTTEAQNTANQFSSKTFTLTADNYTQYKTLLTAAANTEIAACQAMLDIPDLVLPANHSENYTKNGFTYTLSVQYSKGSTKNQVVVKSLVDGGAFGTNSTLTYTTQALANTGLASEQSNRITAMKTACDKSPANTTKTYTKNGLNFTIATTFTKAAGNTTCTIKCLLDGTQYSSATQAVTAANATNLTACSTSSTNQITALENILKNAPANSSETYTKNGFNYTVAKTFTKAAGNATATWTVTCDGTQYGTGTQAIGASKPGDNLTALTNAAGTSLTNLKTALNASPANTSKTYTKNGLNFTIATTFAKAAGNTTCTIQCNLDGTKYSSATQTVAIATLANNLTACSTSSTNQISALETILNGKTPANSSETYTKNGFNYTVAKTFTKTAGNATATWTVTCDGTQYGTGTQAIGATDPGANLTTLGTAGTNSLTNLKTALNASPANTSKTYTKNSLNYTVATTFTKAAGNTTCTIQCNLDGTKYSSATQAVAIGTLSTNLTACSTSSTNQISALETALNASPANTTKTYTKNGLNFTIATTFTKAAGNTTCTIKCLLDGTQYSSATQAIVASTLANNLTACSKSSTDQITALENILKNAPANTSETYSNGNMHFTVDKTFTKSADNATATWVTKCDGVQFGTGTQTIGVTDPGANMTTLNTNATNSFNNLKTNIDRCPADSSETITVHGFKYNLGVFYTKSAGTTKAVGGAKLDGTVYGSTESTFSISTWDSNKTTLTSNASNHKASCRAVIDTSPDNSSATYTVNGLSYNVGTTYSKTAGNSTATIVTTLDGLQQKSNTQSVSVNDLANNISACSSKARTDLDTLKGILDQSPADYDKTQYTIGGFTYTAGATFTKAINSGNVTVNIYCDGEIDETYTATVDATSTANDIDALKATARDKVDALVSSLEGLENDTVNYNVNGFNFVLLSQYTKNYSTKKVTINNFIDGVPYGTPYQTDFDRDNISAYRTEGLNRIEDMKTAVKNAPANTSAKHTVNGFNFTIGTQYEKAFGSTTVYVKTMLDGEQTGTSSTVTYDVTNVAAITSQGSSDLAALRVALNACPANYANTHTKSGMGWRTGVNFSKTEDEHSVRLIATLDGEEYGNAVNMDFDITNISALSTKAAEMESNLNTTLTNVSPADTSENFTIRRFNFNIESCFVKTPGIKTVTTMVKLDGTQYDSYHQEDFNVNTATALNTYNNNLINTLKSRLTSVCPDDIHTTYSRNQFNFVIDAYFSKQPNTDVIDIEYNIDSADLVTSN